MLLIDQGYLQPPGSSGSLTIHPPLLPIPTSPLVSTPLPLPKHLHQLLRLPQLVPHQLLVFELDALLEEGFLDLLALFLQ